MQTIYSALLKTSFERIIHLIFYVARRVCMCMNPSQIIRSSRKRPSTLSNGTNTTYSDVTTLPDVATLPPGGGHHTYENVASTPEATGNDTAAYENVESPNTVDPNNEYERLGPQNEYETLRTRDVAV